MGDAHRVHVCGEQPGTGLGSALSQDIGPAGCVIPLPRHHSYVPALISGNGRVIKMEGVASDIVDVVQARQEPRHTERDVVRQVQVPVDDGCPALAPVGPRLICQQLSGDTILV